MPGLLPGSEGEPGFPQPRRVREYLRVDDDPINGEPDLLYAAWCGGMGDDRDGAER